MFLPSSVVGSSNSKSSENSENNKVSEISEIRESSQIPESWYGQLNTREKSEQVCVLDCSSNPETRKKINNEMHKMEEMKKNRKVNIVDDYGCMPDSRLKIVHETTGVNPHKRSETLPPVGETDEFGWTTYDQETVEDAFKMTKEKHGKICYILFRMLARLSYQKSKSNESVSVLATTQKMIARLFVKFEYRSKFLEKVAEMKIKNPKMKDHDVHMAVYNEMDKECFLNDTPYILTKNEFPYDTKFDHHLLLWINPFTVEREEVNVKELYKMILNYILDNVKSEEEKDKIIKSIYLLENMPVARSIKDMRHFHIFFNSKKFNLGQWVNFVNEIPIKTTE